MINIKVLVENSSSEKKFKAKHGLSILIKTPQSTILLDTGSDDTFIKNARIMETDISSVEHLVLSHSHFDHTGGLDSFVKYNQTAGIYLADNPYNRYYYKILHFFYMPVGLRAKDTSRNRIKTIKNNTKICNDAWIIKNTVTSGYKPSLNNLLFTKKEGIRVADDFSHESTLVIAEGNDLLLFNSCSHTGVTNIIDSVKSAFPDYKIRSFIGGMHLCNPVDKKNEESSLVEKLALKLAEYDIMYYTGHCTGDVSFNILKKTLVGKLEALSTGMEFLV